MVNRRGGGKPVTELTGRRGLESVLCRLLRMRLIDCARAFANQYIVGAETERAESAEVVAAAMERECRGQVARSR